MNSQTAPLYIGGGVLAAVLLFIWYKGFAGAAQATAQAAVGVVTGTVAGTAVGIGEAVGIPNTNATQCQKDIAAGNTWASSIDCSAGTFLSSLFNNNTAALPAQ